MVLTFLADKLVIKGEGIERELLYSEITSAMYSRSKHPRWKAAVAAGVTVIGLFALPILFEGEKALAHPDHGRRGNAAATLEEKPPPDLHHLGRSRSRAGVRAMKKRDERRYELIAPAMNPQELAVYRAIKKLGGGTIAEITAAARPGLKSQARNVRANVRWCLRRLIRIHRLVMVAR